MRTDPGTSATVPRPEHDRRWVRAGLTAAAVVAVLLATTLLPDSDEADRQTIATTRTEPVSSGEFCAAYARLNTAVGDLLAGSPDGTIQHLRSVATTVGELLDGMLLDERARAGGEWVVETILGLEEGADADDMAAIDELASRRDVANAKALGAYVTRVCSP